MKIPFKKIVYSQKLKDEVMHCLDTGSVGLGNKVTEFEEELAKYTGFKYAVAVDSCTSALFLSLKYEHEIMKNNNVLSIPSMTVPLVANAVAEAGFKFVFDGRFSWVGTEYGINGSYVVDSAHELFRNMHDKYDSFHKVCLSFYPTKTIGSADGGAILTDNQDFASWAKIKSTYGREIKKGSHNSWDYDVISYGYKRHYTNLQSIICLEQLKVLDETERRRKYIKNKYIELLSPIPHIDLRLNDSTYLFRISCDKRDDLIKFLGDNGIECGVHFKPLHLMPAFYDIKCDHMDEIHAEYNKILSLPYYDTMTDDEIKYVVDKIKEFVKNNYV